MKKIPVLGLLGAIGSGKSTLAALLEKKGALVLDADRCAGDLLQSPEVRQEIVAVFGDEILDKKNRVDRGKLADKIFTCEEDREKIHAIIHPRVRARIRKDLTHALEESEASLIVLDIPLLLGSELRQYCDSLVLIKASLDIRLERVKKNRGWSRNELLRRDACQPSVSDKERVADHIIENEGTIETLEKKVDAILEILNPQS